MPQANDSLDRNLFLFVNTSRRNRMFSDYPARGGFFIERRLIELHLSRFRGEARVSAFFAISGRFAMVCLWRKSGKFLVRSPATLATVVGTMVSKLENEGLGVTMKGEDAIELSGSEEDPLIQARRGDRVRSLGLPWERIGPFSLYNAGNLSFSKTKSGTLVQYVLRFEWALNWPAIFVLSFGLLGLLATGLPVGGLLGFMIVAVAFVYALAALNSHFRILAFFSQLAQEIEQSGSSEMGNSHVFDVGETS